ncbi:CFI-box-CTERM domain-containing protein [Ralstonia pseudosolanacearum]|uniref:CFI-box-CTERM domain-containing protein n=1 Tax=Ralstonia pseudosolanacearum TaxID=1310165 RepID=UPI0026765519|nr:CFI-box-CTERM domain-containing protein [Ralstonia pseudosolanacearum]MDO3521666.1 CFI-box-CTERM domain-containing protein [Ralstonia pseudosolanacearum]MDO3546433.1 CFI-box-CTERM domain-containing protein [Ralstonia pseudosolanacearum]MDO3551859.1 CFI-box-CTERM domain-containing protein [Ralstonia pseudosolanacearum]MDO3566568.1 CFI-box-CTERM domain-containing protein [Ralstonia pseudosolanacearum]MDO3583070.1 CFI-box-CTERM domain-containing protein [Ralstonia pseudosolanacearum]
MPWAVTLIVKDCSSSAPIPGALVTDGVGGGYTDSYGQFIAVIDDAYTGYVVQISKANYSARNFTFDRSQIGTVQNTCLTVYVAPPSGGGGGGWQISCFIVTAATGSETSEEVAGMRALRDRVSARSALAGRLIEAIYDEYWQFSPAIADRIRDSESARMAVMALVVRPLFAWYQLAGQLALGPSDAAAVGQAEKALRGACPRYLGPAKVAGYLQQLADGRALPASMPPLLAQLAPRLQQALGLPLVRWAILEPLLRTWQGAADHLDMRQQVAAWLGGAPLDTLAMPDAATLHAELADLASLLAFDADARSTVGARLAAAWPASAEALARVDLCERQT